MQGHSTVRRRCGLLGSLIASAFAVSVLPAHADPLSDLKAQVDALQSRLDELKQQQAKPAPDQPVTAGNTAGSFKLPGSKTSATIGGYLKLDAIYSSRSAGVAQQGDQFLFPSQIPVGPTAGANEKEQVTFHARQSRLYFRSSTPSSYGDITTLIEADFFGADGNESASNSHALRLRHAYGTIGRLGAGQFWTNFLNEAAYPETLDFGGPVGQIFVRQAQVRWTQPFTGGDWSVSAENPESVIAVQGSAANVRADDDRVPDLTARVRFNTDFGRYSVQALVRNIRVDSAAAPAAAADRWGGAIGFAGIVPSFGQDDLRFNLNVGNVIGRYQELGFFADGYLGPTGQLELADVVSGYVAYRHVWTPGLRSSLVLAAARANNPEGTFGGVNKRSESAHLNLIWSPVASVNLGAEYVYGKRVVEDDRSGSLNRVQFSGQFAF